MSISTEAMVEREPMTVVVSREGLDPRAERPCRGSSATLAFKGDDALKTAFFAETTSKILVLATNGKVFTLEASKLPGGRGHGEPIRLMVDIEEGADDRRGLPLSGRARRCWSRRATGAASSSRRTRSSAATRKGKRCSMSMRRRRRRVHRAGRRRHVATIGENRKLLVFPLAQVPEMARGKGVRLQRYKDGGIVRRAKSSCSRRA